MFGRTQERLARAQETYIASATSSWLESLERSLVQMKEYQAARKKLETRRLAYDTSLAKMQKAKKEDFRVEEELRNQKAKYEESADDVQRRMEEIRDADPENVADLGTFLDAELAYHEQCREALLQLKTEWPAKSVLPLLIFFSSLTRYADPNFPTVDPARILDQGQTQSDLMSRRPFPQSKCVHRSNRVAHKAADMEICQHPNTHPPCRRVRLSGGQLPMTAGNTSTEICPQPMPPGSRGYRVIP